jgi:uncharacterized protein YcbK (DUF882 family)
MRFFVPAEFTDYSKMDIDLLRVLDRAREIAGIPFKLNDSWRDPMTRPAGGAKRSAHYLGRAVDIDTRYNDYKQINTICSAILQAAVELGQVASLCVEIVNQPHDSHVHFDLGGTFADGYVIPRPALLLLPD